MTIATFTAFNVGDRVRLIDSGGDSSSRANVGDTGTVEIGAASSYDILQVTMDDGHSTRRNANRWELVEETPVLTEAEQRAVWAALPIEQAYPVGSQWHHRSYGSTVFTVAGHRGDGHLFITSDDGDGIAREWVRGALDTLGTPVGLMPETVESDFTVGQRVEIHGWDYDSWNGPGTVTEVSEDYVNVQTDGDMGLGGFARQYIRPLAEEFTPGDRVRIVEVGSGLRPEWVGVEVTYVGLSPEVGAHFHPLEVAFDADSEFTRVTQRDDEGRGHAYVTRVERVVAPSATDTPVEPTVAPTEPYRPVVGERVIVTEDRDQPSNNGKTATVLEVDFNESRSRHLIRVDYSPEGYSSWWVHGVKPLMPATPEEYMSAIEQAKEEGLRLGVETGRREGREAATQEAASHMESIVESAHDYARDNQLCSQFDKFMVENGLPPRDTYTQDYRVDVVYSVYVSARPDDEDAIREAAMERVNSGYESPSIDWEEN